MQKLGYKLISIYMYFYFEMTDIISKFATDGYNKKDKPFITLNLII